MSDDWTTRSAGATRAVRLNTQADRDTFVWSVDASKCSYDASKEAFKIAADTNTDDSQASAVIRFHGNSSTGYGNGDTYWISFRFMADEQMLYYHRPITGGGRPHWKFAIVSRADADGSSNTLGSNPANGETVLQHTWGNCEVNGYRYAPTITHVYENVGTFNSASNGNTFKWCPSVDWQYTDTTPLTGNDPDTGSAWTAAQQERARYSGLWAGEDVADFVFGFGDPVMGGVRLKPNVWFTITLCYEIGAFGSANSRWRCWVAEDGQPYRQLWDDYNITLGNGSAPKHTGIWLTNFTTDGATGGNRITARTSNITGVTIHCPGPGTPSGNGQLEYNATTGRFRWRGNGRTYGTARGYAADIGNGMSKLTFAVKDSVASNEGDYVVITVVPASLPTSGTLVDDVTVSTDGRDTGNVWYKDFIESANPIIAPGGYFPVPAWNEGQAVNAWRQLPANTAMSTCEGTLPNPQGNGPSYKLYAWTGYAWDFNKSKAYSVAQGGHGNYSGNEVDMLDLSRDWPLWDELRAAYATPPNNPNTNYTYYAANEPSSRHGYMQMCVHHGQQKVYQMGGSVWNLGNGTTDTYSYDIAANTYSAESGNSDMPAGSLNLTCCQDPSTDNLYLFGGTGSGDVKWRWNASNNTFTVLSPSPNDAGSIYQSTCAFDSTRREILIVGGPDGDFLYDVDANTFDEITLTGSKATQVSGVGNGAAMSYVPDLDVYIVRDNVSGGTIYQVTPVTWACEEISTTGGSSIPAVNGEYQGHFTKGMYLPNLGGFYLTGGAYTASGWFLKLHEVSELTEEAPSVVGTTVLAAGKRGARMIGLVPR